MRADLQDAVTPTAGGNQVGNRCVLFLDIDGVVNSRSTTNFKELYPIDPYMAFLVGKIQLDTDCLVVLSSSWRNHPDGVAAVEKRVVKIFDKTPWLGGRRGGEVKAWLAWHPEVTKYAILDDDSDFEADQPLFKTIFETGLTEEIAKSVTDHLNADTQDSDMATPDPETTTTPPQIRQEQI